MAMIAKAEQESKKSMPCPIVRYRTPESEVRLSFLLPHGHAIVG